jgi:hypothetical protein
MKITTKKERMGHERWDHWSSLARSEILFRLNNWFSVTTKIIG